MNRTSEILSIALLGGFDRDGQNVEELSAWRHSLPKFLDAPRGFVSRPFGQVLPAPSEPVECEIETGNVIHDILVVVEDNGDAIGARRVVAGDFHFLFFAVGYFGVFAIEYYGSVWCAESSRFPAKLINFRNELWFVPSSCATDDVFRITKLACFFDVDAEKLGCIFNHIFRNFGKLSFKRPYVIAVCMIFFVFRKKHYVQIVEVLALAAMCKLCYHVYKPTLKSVEVKKNLHFLVYLFYSSNVRAERPDKET